MMWKLPYLLGFQVIFLDPVDLSPFCSNIARRFLTWLIFAIFSADAEAERRVLCLFASSGWGRNNWAAVVLYRRAVDLGKTIRAHATPYPFSPCRKPPLRASY